jgi:tRNA nucleotidyltransferase (CCA-adding enzyme)
MKPNVVAFAHSSLKVTNRMFDEAAAPRDLIYFAMADRPVMAGSEAFTGDSSFLFERLAAYEKTMAAPCVTGSDLIEAGLKPDESFSDILAHAHKLRLAGIPKQDALKQTLGYARKYRT